MKRKKGVSGFTLIELLIVVAIIAILAAIAVPNFLEAQVRSKVSRVSADMRTLATALESYAVDSGKYPPGYLQLDNLAQGLPAELMPPPTGVTDVRMGWIYHWLTSPVAYISSVPKDPFGTASRMEGQSGQPVMNSFYDYTNMNTRSLNNWTMPEKVPRQIAQRVGVFWYLRSIGPSRHNVDTKFGVDWVLGGILGIVSTNSWGYPNCFYEPSNGTVSRGQIVRSNRGIEPASGANQQGL